jgi:hypothetical protein
MSQAAQNAGSIVEGITQEVQDIAASFAGIAENIQNLADIGRFFVNITHAMGGVVQCKSNLVGVFDRIRNRQHDNRRQDVIDQCATILSDDLRNDFNSSTVCNSSDNTTNRRLPEVANSYIPNVFNENDETAKRNICFGFHGQITDSTYAASNCDAGVTPGECGQGVDDGTGLNYNEIMTSSVTSECSAFFTLLTTQEITMLYQGIVNDVTQLTRMVNILEENVRYVADATSACNQDLGNIRRGYERNVESLYKVFQCQRLVAHEYNQIARITSTTSTTTASTTTSTEFMFTPASVAPTVKCVGPLSIFAAIHMVVAVLL